MKIRPLHDRVLVERLEEREAKKGGIIIPDTAEGQQRRRKASMLDVCLPRTEVRPKDIKIRVS